MTELTPTTEQVRGALRAYRVHPEEFDLWLKEHDRDVRAKALDEAATIVVQYGAETGRLREVKEALRKRALSLRGRETRIRWCNNCDHALGSPDCPAGGRRVVEQ